MAEPYTIYVCSRCEEQIVYDFDPDLGPQCCGEVVEVPVTPQNLQEHLGIGRMRDQAEEQERQWRRLDRLADLRKWFA